jgi:RNA polymerase primary sigma factor
MKEFRITKSITNREALSFDKYLQEVAREERLTVDQEIELAQKIKMGDQVARDRLVLGNLRFVVSVAKQYQNQGLSLSDLINEGNLGLIKAAERFDETRGFKFISYAVWWIRQSILRALAEQSRLVRLPLNKLLPLNRIIKASSKFAQKNEREPTDEEIADILNVSVDNINNENLSSSSFHFSLDVPVSEGEEGNHIDFLEEKYSNPDQGLMLESLFNEIQRVIATLKDRETKIIQMYYFQGMTFDEIGEDLGLTRERIRQIHVRIIKKLQKSIKSRNLRQFLG